jgi:hypothetical protein
MDESTVDVEFKKMTEYATAKADEHGKKFTEKCPVIPQSMTGEAISLSYQAGFIEGAEYLRKMATRMLGDVIDGGVVAE